MVSGITGAITAVNLGYDLDSTGSSAGVFALLGKQSKKASTQVRGHETWYIGQSTRIGKQYNNDWSTIFQQQLWSPHSVIYCL